MFPFTSTKVDDECDIDIMPCSNEETLSDAIRFNALSVYYVRVSSANKRKLLDSLVQALPNIETLSFLMNIVISQTFLYRKVVQSQADAIDFDKILQDHNRMFTDEQLESVECVEDDIEWFRQLAEPSQESILITFARSGGADAIEHLYKSLYKEYSQRKKQLKIRKESIVVEEKKFTRKKEDIKDSVYLECEKQQNEYRSLIAEYRKKIFGSSKKPKKASKKSKNPKFPKSKAKKSKKSKKPKKSKKGNTQATEEFDIEMIQLMPIWIIKKILSYLDAKTLSSMKKIDTYWKWVVEDYLKDVKMRKKLNEIHANLLSTLDKDYDDKQSSLLVNEEPMRKSFHERKMEKLCQRGAIIEKLRHTDLPLAEHSILYDAILENKEFELNAKLNSPRLRVAKDHIPLYTKPIILYKDVGIFGLQNEIFADASFNVFHLDSELSEEEISNNCYCNDSLNESLGIIQ